MVKKEDKIAYEIEIERSEVMEQEIDRSINQMNDEFRMTRIAVELTDLQGKEEWDKYISKEKLGNLVVNRAEKLFELSSEESNYLRNRLKKYDKMELQHLYHNFTSFGVDAVLECICENEKLKHQNKKWAGTIP